VPAPVDTAIIENEKYSVREFTPGVWGGFIGDGMGILWPGQQGLISGWGTWMCDRDLRMFYYFLHNTLIQGTVDLICQTILSTPYEISGGRNVTYQWQDLFFEADFGEGYDDLVWKFLQDYYTLNRGGFMELVSYGDPSTPLQPGARILGINHLDAMRVVLTGNLDIPYQYYSEYTGKLHNLHRSRVIHLVHAPSPNTTYPHYGKSPLYNVLSQSNAQILLGRHQNEMLSDLPPPGLVIFNNVKPENVEQVVKTFEAERRSDGQQVFRAPLKIEGLKPNEQVSVTFVPLASVPQDFDYEKYMRVHVNLVALGFQVDPQDIWPLTGQNLGVGTQGKILASKATGKGYGYMLTRLERKWNTTMPRSAKWKYKAQNADQDQSQATTAKTWVDTANAATDLSQQERRQLLANQVPQFADVLLDEQGNVRLPDDDPKEPGQEIVDANSDTIATDTTQLAPADNSKPVEPDAIALPVIQQPKQPASPPAEQPKTSSQPSAQPADMKLVEAMLEAGLITIDEAQRQLGVPVDSKLTGFYMLDGVPVPPERISDLWQSRFGRGVVSFDSVLAGDSQTTTVEYAAATKAFKDYDATASEFEGEIAAILSDASAGSINKTSFSARMRSAINKYGRLAMLDGLNAGGVETDELDADDKTTLATLLAAQSPYVSNVANEIFNSDGGFKGSPDFRASLWVAKTLEPFYYAGLQSADQNGMYKFVGTDGEESCITCTKLKNQVHRLKDWVRKELVPRVDTENFECGGWQCQHYLEKTDEKAQGTWKAASMFRRMGLLAA
jgi:hypothetical protein